MPKYVYINRGDQHFFLIWNHHKWLSQLFPLHLNTYVMCLRPLEILYSFSVGIDFRRQDLTSTDVRSWRLKLTPALKGLIPSKQETFTRCLLKISPPSATLARHWATLIEHATFCMWLSVRALTDRVYSSFRPSQFVGSFRDGEVTCSASDWQGSNFESCVWRAVPSDPSHQYTHVSSFYPLEVVGRGSETQLQVGHKLNPIL